MPYIRRELRDQYEKAINDILEIFKKYNADDNGLNIRPKADGEMNYIITKLIDGAYSNLGYAEYNRAIGILECLKLEFYRRKISPYEDKKIQQNGEVYQHFELFNYSTDLSLIQLRDNLALRYSVLLSNFSGIMERKYRLWGYNST